jgi:hypothetical protein
MNLLNLTLLGILMKKASDKQQADYTEVRSEKVEQDSGA